MHSFLSEARERTSGSSWTGPSFSCDAVVVSTEPGFVWVRTHERAGACGACGQKSRCRGDGLGAVLDTGAAGTLLRLPNDIGAGMGDAVMVQMASGGLWRAVKAAYGWPLLLGIAGAASGQYLLSHEVGAGLGLLCGLLMGFVRLYRCRVDLAQPTPTFSLVFKSSPRTVDGACVS